MEQATAKGSIFRTQNTSRFFQESSFLHCLSSTASPQAYTLLSGQALSFATSAAALMPIQAVIMLTEILLLNCCHTLLNNLRLIWFYQWADLTFDPHVNNPEGHCFNTAKTAFLKWSLIQKTHFPEAINYQEKKMILHLTALASCQDINCFSDLLLLV